MQDNSHAHDLGHANHHEHGPDCDCGCHGHSDASDLADSALRFSKKADIFLKSPISAKELEARIAGLLDEAAHRIGEGGAVLGHIKALAKCGGDAVSFSVTRVGAVDKTYMGGWEKRGAIESYCLTLNILSVINTQADMDDIIVKLFAG